MSRIDELLEVVKGHTVLIQTHNFPDPDAIASAYGLQQLLFLKGVDSKIVYSGAIRNMACRRMIDYFGIELVDEEEITISADDKIILVDSQKYNRNCKDLPGQEVACIDHHPTFIDCEYPYKDIRKVGACASLISEYYFDADIEPENHVATVLLYGIKMDTADFGRGVTELDVKMYYKLFPFSDKYVLEKMQLNNIEYKDLKAYGAAINNISVYNRLGFACLPFDCPDGLIAIISDFILSLDIVEFSVVYSIRSGGYKFSVRSEDSKLDAGKIINSIMTQLGRGSGGGHSFMAGGFLDNEGVDLLGDNPRGKIERLFFEEIYPDGDFENSKI